MSPPIFYGRLEADLTRCVDAQSIGQADVRLRVTIDSV
jgi:hypothetical protein